MYPLGFVCLFCRGSVDKEKIVKSSFGGWPNGSSGAADGELSSAGPHGGRRH